MMLRVACRALFSDLTGVSRRFASAKAADSISLDKPVTLYNTEGNVATPELFKNRKVLVFGFPAAFTGTCAKQVPLFVKHQDEILKKGVDEIVGVSVNDPFVLKAFGAETGVPGSKVKLLGDPDGSFVKSIGMSRDFGAPLGARSQRYALLVDNGRVVKSWVEEKPGELTVSSAEKIIAEL